MHLERPARPRVEPLPEVAEKARARMASSPANAVNVAATMAHNRTFSKAIGRFAGTVLTEGNVPPRQRELVILRMGWNCQAIYEFGQHTLFGRDVGLTDAEIYFVTRPLREGGWAPADHAILRLADDLYTDDCVTDATWAAVNEHFSVSDVIELIAAAGCYRLVSGFLNSCGVQLDDGVPGWPSLPPGATPVSTAGVPAGATSERSSA
jgi:alkylhydroperoxidase family enzyme